MANIRDVAKEAGVSIATASRVLSHDETFKTTENTRKKIFDAVEKLGYTIRVRKNTKRKLNLGCVMALTSEKYSDPFFNSILAGAEEACIKHNAAITVLRNYNELKNPQVLHELCTMNLDGLILMENLPEKILNPLVKSIPNIVAIDQLYYDFNTVGFDHYESNMQVMNYLISNGYRRIAYIGSGSPNSSFLESQRVAVYREVLRKNNIPYDESLIMDCHWDLNTCAACAEQILSSESKPDAIFAGSDTLASVILGVIYKLGMKCPDDVGVIGFNNLDISAHMIPALTTVDVPTLEIGRTAVKRLVEIIQNKNEYKLKILFPTKLVIRDSIKEQRI